MSGPRVVEWRSGARAVEREAADHVREGGLLAHPTETVYGLGGRAERSAIEALRTLKARGDEKPFLALLPPPNAGGAPWEGAWARSLAWTPEARALAGAFWPGALTLVLGDPEGSFPGGARSDDGTVAVRMSPHPFVQGLLTLLAEPLLSTSANRPGGPPARSVGEVLAALEGRPGSERCWLVDGGELPPSDPSTLVDCTGSRALVLRRGALSPTLLREVVSDLDEPTNG